MTYSIIGRDPDTGEIGAAVQSKFPGVGSIVLHGRVEAGCLTTQAFSDPMHGETGLALLERGATARQALDELLDGDEGRGRRQIAMLAHDGAPAAFTGDEVRGWRGWSGDAAGAHCVATGNTLAGEGVLAAMVETFETAQDEFAMRLIRALRAGRDAGGELRGLQSAAVLTFKPGGGYGGRSGRHVDIPVYDHDRPIEELARCYRLHRLSYFPSDPEDLMPIDAATALRLKAILRAHGFDGVRDGPAWEESAIAAMARFMGEQNYDNRIRDDALIDREVLEDILEKHPAGAGTGYSR